MSTSFEKKLNTISSKTWSAVPYFFSYLSWVKECPVGDGSPIKWRLKFEKNPRTNKYEGRFCPMLPRNADRTDRVYLEKSWPENEYGLLHQAISAVDKLTNHEAKVEFESRVQDGRDDLYITVTPQKGKVK